jgi:aryl sulfotransferase
MQATPAFRGPSPTTGCAAARSRAGPPLGGAFWDGGAKTFVHKGINGRWRDTLTPEDCARYERVAVEQLGEACARWLAGASAATEAPRLTNSWPLIHS